MSNAIVLMIPKHPPPREYIVRTAKLALDEDIGSGDLTAGLVADEPTEARLTCRQHAVLAGTDFFDAVFAELDPDIRVEWRVKDGETIRPDQTLCNLAGSAHGILSGERSALNLLQTLSATATATRRYVELVKDTDTRILDTRKTIPGLRLAQKYAVVCGGGHNHRVGLYDGVLIKENHLRAGRSIRQALEHAKSLFPKDILLEIEVEDLDELKQALDAGATRILLDNFPLDLLAEAVTLTAGRAELEASGGIDQNSVLAVARTGVDYISVGTITKDVEAVDFSLLVVGPQ